MSAVNVLHPARCTSQVHPDAGPASPRLGHIFPVDAALYGAGCALLGPVATVADVHFGEFLGRCASACSEDEPFPLTRAATSPVHVASAGTCHGVLLFASWGNGGRGDAELPTLNPADLTGGHWHVGACLLDAPCDAPPSSTVTVTLGAVCNSAGERVFGAACAFVT